MSRQRSPMRGTGRQEFVQLRDLSPPPTGSSDTAYIRPSASFEDRSFSGNRDDRSSSPIMEKYPHDDDDESTPRQGNTADTGSSGEEKKGPAVRRRKAWQNQQERKKTTRAGAFYKKLQSLGFVIRWLIFIVPVGVLIAVPIIAGAFEPQAQIAGVRIVWFFTWIESIWLGLWAAKLVARLLPYVFRFLIGVVSASTTKYATVIKALEFPISMFFWSIICLSTFSPIMTQNPTQRANNDTGFKHWESIVQKILTAAFLSSAVYLAERVLVQLIAIHFHKTQYDMRITENKWAVNMLAKLLSHSRNMFPRFGGDFDEEDAKLEPSAFASLRRRGGSGQATGNVTPMQFVNGARRVFQVGAGLVTNVASEVRGDKINQPGSSYQIVVEALLTPDACAALARRIWLAFVQEGNEALLPEDILDVFGEHDREDAEAAFTYFDEDLNGDVSLDEVHFKVLEVSRERKAISASLKDVDSAIGKLDNVLLVIVLIITVFIFIALLDTNFKTLLATSATSLLSLSFIFGATCQEIVASLIFVFVKHPFDVSDRVTINGLTYIVQEMNLMFTILKRTDGTQVQAPNSLLNTLFIDNIRRSAAMLELLNIYVDFGTSLEQIESLRNEMLDFVKRESRDFQNVFDITIADFADLGKFKLTMCIKHKSNWQNEPLRAQRRNKWMCALAMAIKKLGIVASGPGSGEPANPFVIAKVESKALQATDPFQTPGRDGGTPAAAQFAGRGNGVPAVRPDFDMTLGANDRPDESFDVDLRQAGSGERVNAELPFTIEEETDILMADEANRAGGRRNDNESSLPRYVAPAAAYSNYRQAAEGLPPSAQQVQGQPSSSQPQMQPQSSVQRTGTMQSQQSQQSQRSNTRGRRTNSQRSQLRREIQPPLNTHQGYARTSGAGAGTGAGGAARI